MLRTFLARTFSSSAVLTSNAYRSAPCRTRKIKTSEDFKKAYEKCICPDVCPFPIVIKRGKGVNLYDVEGKAYLDFISGHCAVSLGHCHPKVSKVLCEQGRKLTHASRDVMTTALADCGEYLTELFCYDKVLPTSTGSEACQAAVTIAKEWGYKCKGVCPNKAKILIAENNFWGRSLLTGNTDNCGWSPYDTVPFGDADSLDCKARDPNVCAFIIEPIQGDAGIIIPDPTYMKHVREICTRHKILLIADEIHCGLGRAGCLLCCDMYRVRPDILVLGKSFSGGFLPASAVLADSDIMDLMQGNPLGGTYGGNALACMVVVETLRALQEENLIENSRMMGEILRAALCDLPQDVVCEIRGIGLMNAIVLNFGVNPWELTMDMMNNGLLVKSGKAQTIHLCPPLTVNEKDIMKAVKIIRLCVERSRGICAAHAQQHNEIQFPTLTPTPPRRRKSISQYFDINLKDLNVKSKLSESLKKIRKR